jgi:hypothetical protein
MKTRLFFLVLAASIPASIRVAAAAPPTAPEALLSWMPEEVIGYAKFSGLGERLESFLKSPARRDLESTGLARFLMAQEPWQRFQKGLEEFKTATGKEPLQIFGDLLGREVVLGGRPAPGEPELVLITRGSGEKALEGGIKTLETFAQNHLGFLPPSARSTYQEQTIESYDRISYARLGEVLAISTSRPLLEKVIDLAAGRSKSSALSSPLFARAARAAQKSDLLTLALRPGSIPGFHLPEKLDNGVASLLLGGLVGALEGGDLLSASLRAREDSLELELSSILGKGGIPEKYRSFFPPAVPQAAARRLEKRGVLMVAELHRNLAQWWEKREELMVPKAAGDLLGFSQIMSIVFGGRNFQDEVLPEFGPTITLLARNQDYPDLKQKPQPAIPAFAGIFELKGAADFRNSLTAAFQTLVGVINADRAQKKAEGGMMLLKTEKLGEVELESVSLPAMKEARPGLAYNFTPSLAVVGSRLVLSSSRELTRIIVEELSAPENAAASPAGPAVDSLHLDAEAIRSILDQNLDLLVADSMMKKGTGKAEAEGEIKGLLEVLSRLRDLRLETRREEGTVGLKLELRTRLGGAAVEREPSKGSRKKPVSL